MHLQIYKGIRICLLDCGGIAAVTDDYDDIDQETVLAVLSTPREIESFIVSWADITPPKPSSTQTVVRNQNSAPTGGTGGK